jgi:hypothetical protein
VSPTLRLAVALTALPCLAVAGELIGESLVGPHYRWVSAIAGANLAGLMVLATFPEPVIFAVEYQLVVAALVVPLLTRFDVNRVEAAAVVAAVSAALLAMSRRIAATITAWGHRSLRARASAATDAGELVTQSGRLIGLVLAGPAAALLIAFPLLALSGQTFAVALAAILSAGLLARARQAGFTAELLVLGGTGVCGLFVVLIEVARLVWASRAAEAALLISTALVLIGVGAAMSLYGPAETEGLSAMPGVKPPRSRSRAEVVGVITGVSIAPLTMGVFGIFGHLIAIGRFLF